MIHKNKMQKYPVYTTCQNMSCFLLRLKCSWKKIQFQLALNRTFAQPHHPSSTDDARTSKEEKLTKQCFLHWFSPQSSQYQQRKPNTYSILTLIELGLLVLESSTGSQNFMLLPHPPTLILNTNFIKRESKIGYAQDLILHT